MTGGVLWVTAEVPDREGGGGNQRQAYLLRALAEHMPVDLVVAGSVRDETVLGSVRTLVEVARPAEPTKGRIRRRTEAAASAWLRRTPLDTVDEAAVRDRLAARLPELTPDVDAVLLHHQSLGPLLAGPRFGRARWVLSLFHAAAARSEQAAAIEPRRLQRALLRRDAANSARLEHDIVDLADALVVITEEDAARLGRPGTPTHVVPMGIDLDAFRWGPLPAEPSVLLAGSLDYAPNVDGAVWFATAIWPTVRLQVPDARAFVVGRNPAPAVLALHGRDGVEVHPDVPEIASWFAKARVAVVPMRVGTGVRVKAIQALAAGCPVVGTPVGMEGVGVGPEEAAVTDDPATFAAEVVALLRDEALAKRRRAAGRRHAEDRFSWTAAGDVLASALLDTPAAGRPSRQ